jgi:Protein of unknown function (DUF1501)
VDVWWPHTPDLPGGFNLNWDHHDYMYNAGSCGTIRNAAGGEGRYGIGHWVMMGSTDAAFAALIEDLDQRGLLNDTLVCFVTEFGRTPRLNRFQGRDHWTNAYSIVFLPASLSRVGLQALVTELAAGEARGANDAVRLDDAGSAARLLERDAEGHDFVACIWIKTGNGDGPQLRCHDVASVERQAVGIAGAEGPRGREALQGVAGREDSTCCQVVSMGEVSGQQQLTVRERACTEGVHIAVEDLEGAVIHLVLSREFAKADAVPVAQDGEETVEDVAGQRGRGVPCDIQRPDLRRRYGAVLDRSRRHGRDSASGLVPCLNGRSIDRCSHAQSRDGSRHVDFGID